MSEFHIITTSDNLPPSVPTSFVTDINSPAIPAANVLNVVGGAVTTNNINGIQTDGSSGGNTLTVELTNRFTGSTNTPNATPKTIGTLVLQNTPGVYNITLNVAAFATLVPSSAGFSAFATIRTDGAIATLADQSIVGNREADLLTSDFNCVVSGNTVQFQATGIAATSIDWTLLGTYLLTT